MSQADDWRTDSEWSGAVAPGGRAWQVNVRMLRPSNEELGRLPRDLTTSWTRDLHNACGQRWNGWHCTRHRSHGTRHASGNGRVILAVWP